MKKILLSLSLAAVALAGRSQAVLNEVYSEPGSGKSEFIEIYNSSTVVLQPTDCFTVLTYWSSGANHGWYVLDLPVGTIPTKGFFVLAAANPFNTQNTTNSVANVNWNDATFRSGATGGYLKKYQQSGATYTEVNINTPVVAVQDLSVDGDFAGGGHNYLTLLFQNGAIVNGFWGGGASGILPAGITGLPDLSVTPAGACGAAFNIHFASLGAVENVNSSPGSDNGYARTSDGKCGAWVKTSASVNHTPGTTNGSAAASGVGALVTSQVMVCNTAPGVSRVDYNITGVSGVVTEADDFPVEVQLYYDFGTVGTLDGLDMYQSSQFDALVSDPLKSFTIAQTQPVILVYKTKRGCFDRVVALSNGCLPLPVAFKSFSALRLRDNVNLKFETAWEQNSAGFAIERNVNGSWAQVGYLNSLSVNGNSSDLLTYTFTDVNNTKGISQYRIRQVDLDNKSKYSEIRTVRGQEQLGQVIVYPNPSIDGTVNVSFEDATPKDVTVADMSGRIVKQMKGVTSNNITITNLTPGMYTLRAVDPATGAQNVAKIVVNKR
jgi:hypothetical protein